MSGDYTRLNFKPGNDYHAVLAQQGRVLLDADFNEQAELLGRRLRAGTLDVVGQGAVPRQTPDGFRIELTEGDLTIGRGRAYVDGLLAENHGGEPAEYDTVLGEQRGSAPLAYDEQPYLPDPPALPAEGTHLVYLDVWERELTHLEEPLLVEKAIGFDTSTRLQTVWQVRLVEAGEGAVCDGDVEAWEELTRPSAGRLSTRSVGVPTPEDPCIVPPAGGYRGTENRLYRVEIHDPGPLGKATFKWSRDNGSIASPVIEIDAARTTLTLVSIGRDGAHRLRAGDWIEVSDDQRELAGRPGEMRQVDDVEEEAQTVKLAAALPAGAFDPSDPDRHTRITRWDGSGAEVDAAAGLLAVPANGSAEPILLGEEGVEIAFDTDPAGGDFRSGDWWAFAARTADASVEELISQPPRGVHHHYCRLAIVDFPSRAVSDCRTLWPPQAEAGDSCDCTVCVSPEAHVKGTMTIQMAVDRVVEGGGGKICLEPGIYPLESPVYLRKATSICLQGKGRTTILAPTRGLPALYLDGSEDVAIENLSVRSGSAFRGRKEAATAGGIAGTAVVLCDTSDVAIEGCLLMQAPGGSRRAPLIGLMGMVTLTRIRDNLLSGGIGIAGVVATDRGDLIAPRSSLEAAVENDYHLAIYDLRIEDNALRCAEAGIGLQSYALNLAQTRIAGNWIFGCKGVAVVAVGLSGPDSNLEIAGNSIATDGYGIVVATDDARIAGNDVRPMRGSPEARDGQVARGSLESEERRGGGIVLGLGSNPGGIDRCLVLDNRIVGLAGDGISVRSPITSALIERNVIEQVGGAGIDMDDRASAGTLTVKDNQVLDVAPGVDLQNSAVGIRVAAAQEVAVVGNRVIGVGRDAVKGELRCGIHLWGCGATRVAGNDVADIGPADGFVRLGYGIGIFEPLADVDVADNSVRRRRVASAKGNNDRWNALAVLSHFPEEAASKDQGAVRVEMPQQPRVLRLDTGAVLMRSGGVVALAGSPSHLSIRGNLLEAYGAAPCAVLWASATCQFAHNRCVLGGNPGLPAVVIVAQSPPGSIAFAPPPFAVAVDGNHVVGQRGTPGVYLLIPEGFPYTVLGNVASGPIEVNGAPLGSPWAALNAA